MLDNMDNDIKVRGPRKIFTQVALEVEHYNILKKYSADSLIPMAMIVREAIFNHLTALELIAGPKKKVRRVV